MERRNFLKMAAISLTLPVLTTKAKADKWPTPPVDMVWDDEKHKWVQITKTIDSRGWIYYRDKDGLSHNVNDKPAIMRKNVLEWYKEGLRHRDNGPAIIDKQCPGTLVELWYINGKIQKVEFLDAN